MNPLSVNWDVFWRLCISSAAKRSPAVGKAGGGEASGERIKLGLRRFCFMPARVASRDFGIKMESFLRRDWRKGYGGNMISWQRWWWRKAYVCVYETSGRRYEGQGSDAMRYQKSLGEDDFVSSWILPVPSLSCRGTRLLVLEQSFHPC